MTDRHTKGHELMRHITGDHGNALAETLNPLAPEFFDVLVEFAFGEIYARSGLDLRMRELATVAALTALANSPAQLKVHINGALNVGCTPTEVSEVIVQMALYAGFPAALNGLDLAKGVFAARNA